MAQTALFAYIGKGANLDAADEVGWQWPELMADLVAEYYAARRNVT